jgi:hypothetical protein
MGSGRGRPTRRAVASVLAGCALLFVAASVALADGNPQPVDFVHNVTSAPAPVAGAVFGTGSAAKIGTALCTTKTSNAANVNTDCTDVGPTNETSIAVNPTNPQNIIGGANDYQLGVNPGGHISETVLSRAHVSFDGGKTWSEYPLDANSRYQATGDPSVAFDATGRAYYATLGFRFVGPNSVTNPDVRVGHSTDAGRSWHFTRIAQGTGNLGSVGPSYDKEYVAAWGNGNAIVTFGDFQQGQKGAILSSRIYSSVTHDGGVTWSHPQVISGSLDEAFVSTPTVAADGRIYVSFLNTSDLTTGRDTYEVVQVSPSTGARVAGPTPIAKVIDGATDYPIALGRPTYQDSVFRTWAPGNITADPSNARHLAVIWSDMRNSELPASSDPYSATTNSDVIVSQSFDRGRHWSKPVAIERRGDQFMPWGAYDGSGTLHIGMFDRGTTSANHRYDYSVATETSTGSLSFSVTPVSTVKSDPTKNDEWFARTLNPAFPNATAFLGDYTNIAIDPSSGDVLAYWTDMRNSVCFAGACGHGQDGYFARVR